MKPTHQIITEFGKGDCWRACIASILELNVEDVPNFVGETSEIKGRSHYDMCKSWLKQRGLFLLDFCIPDGEEWYYRIDWTMLEGAYCILSVPSQKNMGGWHSVVGKIETLEGQTELKIVHDPRIDNDPYPSNTKFRRIQFVVNFVPKIC